MHFNSQSGSCQNNHNRISRPLIVLLLFATAFGIRMYHINRPPLDFSPIRQYQNAHIIRGIYYEKNDLISESRKQTAKLNMERMGLVMEPRIIENTAVIGYRLMGAEHLWIPRLISAVFWISGGILLYLIARINFSPGIALFSAIFYLFLPYSILSSRAIQPDPLMVMMMLFSVYRVLKYDDNPSLINLITAAIVTAIAVLIKPYCIFIIFCTFFSLLIFRMGIRKALFHRDTLAFSFIIVLPAAVYYAYGLLTHVGFLGVHARGSFLPHLIIYPPFWGGWLIMIGNVTGYIAFFLAILGLLTIQKGRAKALLLGLWTGYFLFGLSATYQIHTHSYYHMPFIPIAALSLGALISTAMNRVDPLLLKRLNILMLSFILLAIVIGFGLSMSKLPLKNILSDYKSGLKTVAAFIGINPGFGKFLGDDFDQKVRIAKEIGEHVRHSNNTIFLTPDFGRVLAYHGEFSGLPWPTSRSLYGRRLRGTKLPSINNDFTAEYITILYQGKFIRYSPDYFVITAFDEFDKQQDLKEMLNSNFPIVAQSDDYLIFDLRTMSELSIK